MTSRSNQFSVDIEGVGESILAPETMFQLFIEQTSNGKGQRRNKGYRRDCAGGRDGAVLGTVDCSVGSVPVRAVAGIESPEALGIRLNLGRPVHAILAMYVHGIRR